MGRTGEEPQVGQLRRHRALGTEAVYQVTALLGDLVEVEVVRVPGLDRGTRLKFTAVAVAAMELIGEHPGTPEERTGRVTRRLRPRLHELGATPVAVWRLDGPPDARRT